MTALDALTRRTVSDAIQGKSSAIKLVLAYVERLLPKSAAPAALEPEKDHVASLRSKIEKMTERLESSWTDDEKSAADR